MTYSETVVNYRWCCNMVLERFFLIFVWKVHMHAQKSMNHCCLCYCCISTPITLNYDNNKNAFIQYMCWLSGQLWEFKKQRHTAVRPVRYLSQNWSLTRAFFFQTVSQFKLDFHRLSGYIYKCKLVERIFILSQT